MVSAPASDAALLTVLAAGANGYLVEESEPRMLHCAARAVATGGTFVDPRVAASLVRIAMGGRFAGPFGLTVQEVKVLGFLPGGLKNREIAQRIGVSENTVKTHLRNALRKLGARDRAEGAAVAVRLGLG